MVALTDADIERVLRRKVLNPVTLKTHLSRMSSIKGRMKMRDFQEVLRHPDKFARAIDGDNPRTATNAVTTILAVIKHVDGLVTQGIRKKWLALHSKLQRAQEAIYRRNQPLNDRQRQNYVSIDEVRAKVAELLAHPPPPTLQHSPSSSTPSSYPPSSSTPPSFSADASKGSGPHATLRRSMALLLFAFYAYLTPKRSDLGELRVFRGKGPSPRGNIKTYDGNYVVLPNEEGAEGILVIRKHKTASAMRGSGDIVEAVPPKLVRMIETSINKHPRDHVFVDREGHPYSNNSYTKYVIRTFAQHFDGRKAGTALLRHAYVTDQVDFNKMSVEERERIARLMGHDIKMQGLVYKWVGSPLSSPSSSSPSSSLPPQSSPSSPSASALSWPSHIWTPISVVDKPDGTRCVCMRKREKNRKKQKNQIAFPRLST